MIDVVVIGGGPAGLAAALVLGRSRKQVVVVDGGRPRNAAARHVHGFVTRDGVSPEELRAIGHAELRAYPSVSVHVDAPATTILRVGSHVVVRTAAGELAARRALLCTGLIDEPLAVDGAAELWGTAVFVCPYCDGWEVRDRRLGYLAPDRDSLVWSRLLRGWSRDVVVFTGGGFPVPPDARRLLAQAGIPIEERRVIRLVREGEALTAVQLDGGGELARDAMFVRPPQRQVPVVAALGLALDDRGLVKVDAEQRTSLPTVFAAGDLITPDHGATAAAASGSRAAHNLNLELTIELVAAGQL